jgi:preprotein translocase subunit SecG
VNFLGLGFKKISFFMIESKRVMKKLAMYLHAIFCIISFIITNVNI